MNYPKPERDFFNRDDVVTIARELLGMWLCTNSDGVITKGRIVETEAYDGSCDKACHAFSHGKTARNEIMFGEPGFAYVYLCYGIHHLFNVVTNKKGKADAVLIRAIEPVYGIDTILERRNQKKSKRNTGGGPGIVSSALNISTVDYGADLLGNRIWIENPADQLPPDQIIATPRVGVDYAGEDAFLPWRFRIKNNPFTSPAK